MWKINSTNIANAHFWFIFWGFEFYCGLAIYYEKLKQIKKDKLCTYTVKMWSFRNHWCHGNATVLSVCMAVDLHAEANRWVVPRLNNNGFHMRWCKLQNILYCRQQQHNMYLGQSVHWEPRWYMRTDGRTDRHDVGSKCILWERPKYRLMIHQWHFITAALGYLCVARKCAQCQGDYWKSTLCMYLISGWVLHKEVVILILS
jgi:hypothetical protein